MSSSLGGLRICAPCSVELWTYSEVPTFYPGNVFYFNPSSDNNYDKDINLFGYFDIYDNRTMTGNWTIRFVQSNIDDYDLTYQLVTPSSNDSVSYSVDKKGKITFNGSFPIMFKNRTLAYSINGSMVPNHQETQEFH